MNDYQPTRVAIASDQAIFLRGLTSLVMSIRGLQLVGEARSGAESIQLCQLYKPDLVLLDLKNPFEYGREIARQICQQCPRVKIILLVSSEEESQAEDELDGLPLNYFSRDISEQEFRGALAQVMAEPTRECEQADSTHPVYRHQLSADENDELVDAFGQQPFIRSEEILERELVMAGKIQADILPEQAPLIPGWDIAARLEPARETSGDFYDFIPLTDRKLGVVVADVTDKGMGAALFMALSSTLIRTYATRFPTLPAITMSAVSERILSDTRGSMFVTAFYGILEPKTGRVVFANAGHPPGYLITNQRGRPSIDALRPTGMALGVSEKAQWKQKIVKLSPGDVLILYTDGITEAQNEQGDFFAEDHLLDAALAKPNGTAREIEESILDALHKFVGPTPRQDDIALVVIRRVA